MLAGFYQGGGGLAGAGIEPAIVCQQPRQAGAAGSRRRLAVEQRRKKSQCIDELTHRGGGGRVRRRGQQQFQPGDAALGESGPGDPQTRAAARFAVGERIGEISVTLHGRLVGGQGGTRIRQDGAQQVGQEQRQRLRQEALVLFRVGPR